MTWISLQRRLNQLPLLLAGPILRRTEPDAVTVWVALKDACHVMLSIYATEEGIDLADQPLLRGTQPTVAVGQHLHVVAVTARLRGSDRLQPGTLYAYDLTFRELSSGAEYTLQQALQADGAPPVSISYFAHQRPTFALPPDDLNQLRIVHGSCRKPHGAGRDTLAILDDLIARSSDQPNDRPHQLFFTGDQIYGDDVANPLLWMLTDAGDTLLGWEEPLPLQPTPTEHRTHITSRQFKPGDRHSIAEHQAGLTAGLRHKHQRINSHLLSFGEYCASYLFAWSPTLWPDVFPTEQDVYGDTQSDKRWTEDLELLRDFQQTLEKVRRSLANVPTYMIFDDHDISDDWYLNQAWCLRVLGKPLGRRTVQNGLLAYALFQGWGNTPDQFRVGKPGEQLLKATQTWSESAGKETECEEAIARYLGLPPTDPITKLPHLRADQHVLILDHDPQSLQWHYTVRSPHHEVIVLDTRTWRGYPADQAAKTPPMLLSPTAFDQQLRQSFQDTDQASQTASSRPEATVVIAPTNLFHMQILTWIQRWSLKHNKVFDNDVGDAWNINQEALAELLTTLFERRDQIVVLSGDIHHGFAVHLKYWNLRDSSFSIAEDQAALNSPHTLVQLTSSAIKNTEFKTRLIHTKLKSLFPEPRQTQSGPNWRYQVQWIKRQPAHTVFEQHPVRWSQFPRPHSAHWLTRFKRAIAWLWRNRWFQDGRETVGQNNIGVVQLQWSADPTQRSVWQDLYWYPLWNPASVVFSRFRALLIPVRQSSKN